MHEMKQPSGWQETVPFSRTAHAPWTSKKHRRWQHGPCHSMRRRHPVRASFLPGAEPRRKPAAQSSRWPSSTHQGFGGRHEPKPVKRNTWNIGVSMPKKSNRNARPTAVKARRNCHPLGNRIGPRPRGTLGLAVPPTAKLGFGLPATRIARSTLAFQKTQPYRFRVRTQQRANRRRDHATAGSCLQPRHPSRKWQKKRHTPHFTNAIALSLPDPTQII